MSKVPGKLVLDTELIQIYDTGSEYAVYIIMSEGGLLEHEPMPRDLRGLIAALNLATEVCAGKFYPKRVVDPNTTKRQIEKQVLKIPRGDA